MARSAPRTQHDLLYQQGVDLVTPYLPINQPPTAELSDDDRAQLGRGIELFQRVLAINAENWAAMWMAGMTLRRLGELEPALEMFIRAAQLSGDNTDVPREAGITAMDLGRPADAIAFATQAVHCDPNDPGLVANLALAHLLNQDPTEPAAPPPTPSTPTRTTRSAGRSSR